MWSLSEECQSRTFTKSTNFTLFPFSSCMTNVKKRNMPKKQKIPINITHFCLICSLCKRAFGVVFGSFFFFLGSVDTVCALYKTSTKNIYVDVFWVKTFFEIQIPGYSCFKYDLNIQSISSSLVTSSLSGPSTRSTNKLRFFWDFCILQLRSLHDNIASLKEYWRS